jgi:NADH:ubiquinone oxidoreductase subunit E
MLSQRKEGRRDMEKNEQHVSATGRERESLLAVLEDEQMRSGFVSKEFISGAAESFGLPLSEVYGVATFYSFITTKPLGRNVIRICKSLPCFLKNAEMIIRTVENELGIKPGETTPDKRYSFGLTNCVGACDKAPAMLINDDVHGDLTPSRISEVLRLYK